MNPEPADHRATGRADEIRQGSLGPAGILGAGWLTTDELAEHLGVDASTLRRWRTARPAQGPPFVRLSSRVTLYSVLDVECWLVTSRVDPNRAA